jgi:hypothetical protein
MTSFRAELAIGPRATRACLPPSRPLAHLPVLTGLERPETLTNPVSWLHRPGREGRPPAPTVAQSAHLHSSVPSSGGWVLARARRTRAREGPVVRSPPRRGGGGRAATQAELLRHHARCSLVGGRADRTGLVYAFAAAVRRASRPGRSRARPGSRDRRSRP